MIVDTTPPISHCQKVLAMIRNFHVHYVAHPTFQDQEVHSGSHCSSQESQMFV
ncbi:unnamed protein product, partial [Vitis vinifera]